MSIEKINENIRKNIEGRHGADEVLLALEIVTRYPKMFQYSSFFENLLHHDESDQEEDSEEEERVDFRDTEKSEPLPKYPPMGFNSPVMISDNMKGFLTEAFPNEGYYATEEGISNRNILTRLFTMYINKNNLKEGPFIKVSPLMEKWFGDLFDDSNNKLDRDIFRYTAVQILVSLNIIKNITEEQMDYMYSEEVLKKLDDEQKITTEESNNLRNNYFGRKN